MDSQLLLFRRQYFQLFEPDFLAWPPEQLLRDPGVQAWMYRNLFDSDRKTYLPSERYQVRTLKPLIAKIEKAIQDPEEDVGAGTFTCYLSTSVFSCIAL
jgi:protein-lysine N-methyltransferase EEF2KMT